MFLSKCPTCGRREPRSLEQNAFYWEFLGKLAKGIKPNGHQSDAKTWALYFRKMFLGYIETRLPDGDVIAEIRSTTDCDKDEFSTYLTKCQVYALEELGFFMPEKEGAGWSKGIGTKVSDLWTIPLCRQHHDELHASPMQWEERNGSQWFWVCVMLEFAASQGVIGL